MRKDNVVIVEFVVVGETNVPMGSVHSESLRVSLHFVFTLCMLTHSLKSQIVL